jgi:hypothetical protein
MQFSLTFGAPHLAEADALMLSAYEGESLQDSLAAADSALGGALTDLISTGDFIGKPHRSLYCIRAAPCLRAA